MKRSRNPFKGHQEQKVSNRVNVITDHLRSLKKTRASFEYPTDLAKAVAIHVALIENKPCSFTTLLRNKRYKKLLLAYMRHPVVATDNSISEASVNVRVKLLELDLVNVQRDNERLRTYIIDLENRVGTMPVLAENPVVFQGASEDALRLSNDRALACKALWLVMEHFQGVVSVDATRRCIIDLSASQRKNVIVPADVAKAFLDWLAESSWVGA